MREIRPSGSEGGARSIPCPYPYQFTPELEKLHPDNSDSHREQAVKSAITP